jgi:uncharacterized protein (DUF362 family)
MSLLDSLGGLDQIIKPKYRVLLKPNLISTPLLSQTHPSVIIELAKLIREFGAEPFIGDSTAWNSVFKNAESSGLLDLCLKESIPLVELDRPVKKRKSKFPIFSQLALTQVIEEADVIINLPKLKCHQQLLLTAGIKNMFGCIPGKRKAWWHFKLGGNPLDFGRMLVEIYHLTRPALTIIDGIDVMEGAGPINGFSRRLGVLIGSSDAVAAELAACKILKCSADDLVTVQAARERNIGVKDFSEIEIVGSSLEEVMIDDFKFPSLVPIGFSLPRVVKSALTQVMLLAGERFFKKAEKEEKAKD